MRIGDAIGAMAETHRPDRPSPSIGAALAAVGLPDAPDFQRRYPHQLSGGQQQRVCISAAIVCEPPVVVFDEPTTGLDVVTQALILDELMRLRREREIAMLYVAHDLAVVAQIATRIAVMYAGRLVEVGTAEQIHNEPAHPYTRGLLASFPSVHGARKGLAGIPGTPPDLRSLPAGCPFVPRCRYATAACATIDMRMMPVAGSASGHISACPFVAVGEAPPSTPPTNAPAAAERPAP